MSKKAKTLETLADYYIQKGKVLSEKEYKAATDAPIRYKFVKRQFSNWARINKMVERNFPEKFGQINSNPIDEEKLAEAEQALKVQLAAEQAEAAQAEAERIVTEKVEAEKAEAEKAEAEKAEAEKAKKLAGFKARFGGGNYGKEE